MLYQYLAYAEAGGSGGVSGEEGGGGGPHRSTIHMDLVFRRRHRTFWLGGLSRSHSGGVRARMCDDVIEKLQSKLPLGGAGPPNATRDHEKYKCMLR